MAKTVNDVLADALRLEPDDRAELAAEILASLDGPADPEAVMAAIRRLAGRWYEARREHLGIEFFDAVDATIDQIVAMPRAGPRIRQLPANLVVRRRAVTRFPYHVVYLELASHIRILAIAHDRRKPGYWKQRLR